MTTREALMLILNAVDYTKNRCRVNEMVGAVLPSEDQRAFFRKGGDGYYHPIRGTE